MKSKLVVLSLLAVVLIVIGVISSAEGDCTAGIKKEHLDPDPNDFCDDVTIEIDPNNGLQLKDGGITTAKMADGTCTGRAQAVGTTNIYATNSWTSMDGMTINMTTNGGDVLLMYTGNIYASGNDNAAGVLSFSVDGSFVQAGSINFQMAAEAGDGGWENDFSMHWLVTSLTAGAHTFKVEWKKIAGATNTVKQLGATYPRVFTAIEFKK